MLNIGQVQDLLVSYTPTHTRSQEQAYPLEMLKEPISGGDAYYEDFTDGLRRFAQARSLVLGGAAGAAIVLDLTEKGGGGADPMNGGGESDDELDAQAPPARVTGGSTSDSTTGGAPGRASDGSAFLVSPITSAVVDRAATGSSFRDGVRSLYAYAKRVGGATDAPGGQRDDGAEAPEREFVMVGKSGNGDGGCGCGDGSDPDEDAGAEEYTDEYADYADEGEGEDSAAEEQDYPEEDVSEVRGAMDETERELAATQQDEDSDSTILSAIVETASRSS